MVGTYCSSDTTACWYEWCGTGTAATSTSDTDTTWVKWNTGTATSTSTGECLIEWNRGYARGTYAVQKPREKTQEEIAAQKKAEAEYQERMRKEAEERKAAEVRAAELLSQHLDDEQADSLAKSKRFHVVGSDGERYEIYCTKRQHNVFALDAEGKRKREYCIVQTGPTPLSDHLLSQKLLLEADAERFKKIANKWDLVPARRAV